MNMVASTLDKTCTLYVSEKLSQRGGVKEKIERLRNVLTRLGFRLVLCVTPYESDLVFVAPFGVFEKEEIDVLIRQLEQVYN